MGVYFCASTVGPPECRLIPEKLFLNLAVPTSPHLRPRGCYNQAESSWTPPTLPNTSCCESRIDTVSGRESLANCEFFLFTNNPKIECSPIVYRSALVAMIGVGSFIPCLVVSRGQIEYARWARCLLYSFRAEWIPVNTISSVLRMALIAPGTRQLRLFISEHDVIIVHRRVAQRMLGPENCDAHLAKVICP